MIENVPFVVPREGRATAQGDSMAPSGKLLKNLESVRSFGRVGLNDRSQINPLNLHGNFVDGLSLVVAAWKTRVERQFKAFGNPSMHPGARLAGSLAKYTDVSAHGIEVPHVPPDGEMPWRREPHGTLAASGPATEREIELHRRFIQWADKSDDMPPSVRSSGLQRSNAVQ